MTDYYYPKKPDWLKVRVRKSDNYGFVKMIIKELSLNTVCEEANCPNRGECFNQKTATFMILGNICTRNCTFCNVTKGQGEKVNLAEPENIALAVKKLELKYVVITSVTRDDLRDGGAGHFALTIQAIKRTNRNVAVEVLIPDLKGNSRSLMKVVSASPTVISHNLETIPRLYSEVRPHASYQRSLELLNEVKKINPHILTKSGIMLGLGETEPEVIVVLQDLLKVNCDFLTIGQYLAPSKRHHPIDQYLSPDVFEQYRKIALNMGFKDVASAPLVRSSYHAADMLSVH